MFKISSDKKHLRLLGKKLDLIKRILLGDLKSYASSYPTISYVDRYSGWRKSCETGFSLFIYPTGESVEEAVWRTLLWGGDDDNYPAGTEPADKLEGFRDWHRILTLILRRETCSWMTLHSEISSIRLLLCPLQ